MTFRDRLSVLTVALLSAVLGFILGYSTGPFVEAGPVSMSPMSAVQDTGPSLNRS